MSCLRIRSRQRCSAVPSRVRLLIPRTQAESGAYTRDSSRFPLRRPRISSTAIGSGPSLLGHAIAYRWRPLLRVRRHRANSSQGSLSNSCCLFIDHLSKYQRRPNVWSSLIAEYGSTRYGCQSCSSSAEQFFFILSPFGPEFGLARWVRRSCPARRPSFQARTGRGKKTFFAPEGLVSLDELGRPVPRQPAYSPHSG